METELRYLSNIQRIRRRCQRFFLGSKDKVDVNDEDGKPKSCRISVAFSMEKIDLKDADKSDRDLTLVTDQQRKEKSVGWRIKQLVPGRVSIYFPADKETSNLGFHINAPFASTVARDSVRDCSANIELRNHLASLVRESMSVIRDQGLLTTGFLAVLPNDKDNLPSFYQPILDSLVEAFKSEELIPMKQGGHAAARKVFKGLRQLTDLITDEDLATILGENDLPRMWIANPPQRNQREDNFLSMLDIPEWTTQDLVKAFSAQPDSMTKWLRTKSDSWHQALYSLLGAFLSNAPSFEAQNRKERLASLRIVRISGGSYNVGKECYFPSDRVEQDDLMPRVAKGVYMSGKDSDQQAKAKEFLSKVGVRDVGESEQVEAILKHRYSQTADHPASFSPDIEDIKRFIALVKVNPYEARLFQSYPIFKTESGQWGTADQVFIDSPFRETDLAAYYEALAHNSERWALSSDYNGCGIGLGEIADFAERLGSRTGLAIVRQKSFYSIDYTIADLNKIIHLKNLSLSRLIWRTVVSEEKSSSLAPDYLRRQSRKDGRYNFSSDGNSSLIAMLKQYEWVPQKNHDLNNPVFVRPTDADSKLLPEGFPFDTGWKWLTAVGFGSSIRLRQEAERFAMQRKTAEYQAAEVAAKSLGFESSEEAKEIAVLKQNDPEGYRRWRESSNQKPLFPIRRSGDPERRQSQLAIEFGNSVAKTYEARTRSVRVTVATQYTRRWLEEQYSDDDGTQMVCQICKQEMPFRKRDGKYHFEAVEALSRNYFTKEHEAQFLALCPLCAARYKEFVTGDASAMQHLRELLLDSDGIEVPLQLGDLHTSLRFVETHREDLRTIIQMYSEDNHYSEET